MGEILETRQHESVEHKWKWKVLVSLYLLFFSFTHFISRKCKRGGFISQTEAISVACKGIVGHSRWGDVPFTGVEHREGSSSCLYTVYYGHIIMFCIIPSDLSRDTVLYQTRYKGHPFFTWSEVQKHHSKWIIDTLLWNQCKHGI